MYLARLGYLVPSELNIFFFSEKINFVGAFSQNKTDKKE